MFQIFEAIESNNLNLLEELIKTQTYDINMIVNYKWECESPLHFAVRFNHVDCIALLLLNGTDINVRNVQGETPLHRAVVMKNIKILKMLLFLNADVNARTNFDKTALHYSVNKNIKIVNILLKNGINVNMRDYWGWTALHSACYHSDKNMINELFEWNANFKLKNNHDQTSCEVANNKTRKFIDFLFKKKEIWNLWELS